MSVHARAQTCSPLIAAPEMVRGRGTCSSHAPWVSRQPLHTFLRAPLRIHVWSPGAWAILTLGAATRPRRNEATAGNGTAKTNRRAGARPQHLRQTPNIKAPPPESRRFLTRRLRVDSAVFGCGCCQNLTAARIKSYMKGCVCCAPL